MAVRFYALARLVVFGLVFAGLASYSFAEAWRIEGDIASSNTLKKLKFKYPQILSASDLQNLLRDFARAEPLAQLDAHLVDGVWVIAGKRTDFVSDIQFELVTRLFRGPLDNYASQFLGMIDSEVLRQRIIAGVLDLLANNGFPQAKVQLRGEGMQKGLRYIVKVDYGSACLIEGIKFGFELPHDMTFETEPGDLCDKEKLADDLDTLREELRERGYSQIKIAEPRYIYNPRANAAKVLIQGSIGYQVKYEIIDKDKLLILSDIFSGDELSHIDPSIIGPEAMAAEIVQSYRNRGYDDVKVEKPEMVRNPRDPKQVTYRFKVDPGIRYDVTNIQFQGVSVFTHDQLLEMMGYGTIWQTNPPYNMDEIRKGFDGIQGRYRKLGYWNAEVREPRVTKNSEKGTVQIAAFVEEGLQRKFADFQIAGNKEVPTKELRDMFSAKVGEPLDQAALVDFERNIREYYVNRGFLYSEVTIKLEFRKGLTTVFTNVNVQISEGSRVRIGDIQVLGLVDTKEVVVRRELYFAPGNWYDPEKIDQSRRALLALGLFRSVQISPADPNALNEKLDTLDILIDVREGNPGQVAFGPGWSLYRGNRFGVESSYNNISGLGRQIYARARLSEEANQRAISGKTLVGRSLGVGYLEPYIFDLPVNGSISATTSARADDKWVLTHAGEVALIHRLRHILVGSEISLFYGQKLNREISSVEQEIGYLRIIGGDARTGKVGVRYNWDKRNDLTWPTQGFILNTEVSTAQYQLGGDLKYYFWKIANSHYFGLTRRTVLAVGVAFNSFLRVERENNADILPQSEVQHMGGADTVRGFGEQSLGPIVIYDDLNGDRIDEPTGGSHSAVYKVEVRYQVIENTFAISTFTDSGNVFFSNTEMHNFREAEAETHVNEERFRNPSEIKDNHPYLFEETVTNPKVIYTNNYLSYGLALNYLTPLGSINLAYGLPWKRCGHNRDDCEKERGKHSKHWLLDGYFHINVGANF